MRTMRILRRIVATVPLAVGIVLLTFLLLRLMPGDPVDIMLGQGGNTSMQEIAALRRELHLEQPLWRQLWLFTTRLAHGDLGHSIRDRRPVAAIIVETLPATVELAAAALLVALAAAVPVGVATAVRHRSAFDRAAMTGAFFGISMPAFWLGLVLMMVFAVGLGWLPTSGRVDAAVAVNRHTGFLFLDSLLEWNWAGLRSGLAHLVLPAVTLGAELMAIISRVVRSSMLEVLRMDYVRVARAKGLSEARVIFAHALRNALIPTVTVLGLQMGVLMGGNMIVETVFGWPGLGRLVVGAIFARDYPVVQGAVMLYAFTFLCANLIVDVMYTVLNPKISL